MILFIGDRIADGDCRCMIPYRVFLCSDGNTESVMGTVISVARQCPGPVGDQCSVREDLIAGEQWSILLRSDREYRYSARC